MLKFALLAILAAHLWTIAAFGQKPGTPAAETGEIEALSRAWMKAAFLERDAKTVERLTAPDFRLIFPAQEMVTYRDQWIRAISGIRAKWFRHEHVTVIKYGTSVAAVSGIFRIDATIDGRAFSPLVAVTDVWEKRDGKWMIVTRFATHPEDISPASAKGAGPD